MNRILNSLASLYFHIVIPNMNLRIIWTFSTFKLTDHGFYNVSRSQTIGTNLRAPLKSRENFESFHATPNRVLYPNFAVKPQPVLHVQDVLDGL